MDQTQEREFCKHFSIINGRKYFAWRRLRVRHLANNNIFLWYCLYCQCVKQKKLIPVHTKFGVELRSKTTFIRNITDEEVENELDKMAGPMGNDTGEHVAVPQEISTEAAERIDP